MKLGLAAVLSLTLFACAGSEPDSSVASVAANETEAAVVHFGTDSWAPTWSGALTPGGTLEIDYDFDRLPECRNQGHVVSWVMEASYRFDGGAWQSVILPGSPGAASTTNELHIPEGAKSLDLWFTNRAVGGYDHCVAYDSQFGANYTRVF